MAKLLSNTQLNRILNNVLKSSYYHFILFFQAPCTPYILFLTCPNSCFSWHIFLSPQTFDVLISYCVTDPILIYASFKVSLALIFICMYQCVSLQTSISWCKNSVSIYGIYHSNSFNKYCYFKRFGCRRFQYFRCNIIISIQYYITP